MRKRNLIEKISYGISAFLILMAITFCFLINFYFGLIMLAFIVGTLWWIMVRRKKIVDRVLLSLAHELNFDVEKSVLKYFQIKGAYNGYPVEIGVYKDSDAFGGVGTLLSALTGEAAWSTLNIRNFMGIKLVHNLRLSEQRFLAEGFPAIATTKNEIYLFFSGEFASREEIKRGLDKLVKAVVELKKQAEKTGSMPFLQ